jgi:hypothetical protein
VGSGTGNLIDTTDVIHVVDYPGRRISLRPDPPKDAIVLAAVKMLWGGSGETYPSLH